MDNVTRSDTKIGDMSKTQQAVRRLLSFNVENEYVREFSRVCEQLIEFIPENTLLLEIEYLQKKIIEVFEASKDKNELLPALNLILALKNFNYEIINVLKGKTNLNIENDKQYKRFNYPRPTFESIENFCSLKLKESQDLSEELAEAFFFITNLNKGKIKHSKVGNNNNFILFFSYLKETEETKKTKLLKKLLELNINEINIKTVGVKINLIEFFQKEEFSLNERSIKRLLGRQKDHSLLFLITMKRNLISDFSNLDQEIIKSYSPETSEKTKEIFKYLKSSQSKVYFINLVKNIIKTHKATEYFGELISTECVIDSLYIDCCIVSKDKLYKFSAQKTLTLLNSKNSKFLLQDFDIFKCFCEKFLGSKRDFKGSELLLNFDKISLVFYLERIIYLLEKIPIIRETVLKRVFEDTEYIFNNLKEDKSLSINFKNKYVESTGEMSSNSSSFTGSYSISIESSNKISEPRPTEEFVNISHKKELILKLIGHIKNDERVKLIILPFFKTNKDFLYEIVFYKEETELSVLGYETLQFIFNNFSKISKKQSNKQRIFNLLRESKFLMLQHQNFWNTTLIKNVIITESVRQIITEEIIVYLNESYYNSQDVANFSHDVSKLSLSFLNTSLVSNSEIVDSGNSEVESPEMSIAPKRVCEYSMSPPKRPVSNSQNGKNFKNLSVINEVFSLACFLKTSEKVTMSKQNHVKVFNNNSMKNTLLASIKAENKYETGLMLKNSHIIIENDSSLFYMFFVARNLNHSKKEWCVLEVYGGNSIITVELLKGIVIVKQRGNYSQSHNLTMLRSSSSKMNFSLRFKDKFLTIFLNEELIKLPVKTIERVKIGKNFEGMVKNILMFDNIEIKEEYNYQLYRSDERYVNFVLQFEKKCQYHNTKGVFIGTNKEARQLNNSHINVTLKNVFSNRSVSPKSALLDFSGGM